MAIVEYPLAHPRVHGEARRALVRRFPYAIYFRAMSDEVVVLAVMHGRRFPRRWRLRR
jgi:plasmid stabilization system protein ParE